MDKASASPDTGRDEASYLRGERRVLRLVLLFALPLFLVVFLCVPGAGPILRLYTNPSAGMMPTISVGSYLLVSRASYGYSRYSFDLFELPIRGRWPALLPQRGDIIAFRLPRDHATAYVKRVVGLPADRIQMIKGRLAINGQVVARTASPKVPDPSGGQREVETYVERLPEGTSYRIIEVQGDTGAYDNTAEYTVPADHLFVLGDNRDNSSDSRHQVAKTGVGYVPVELVIGRVVTTF